MVMNPKPSRAFASPVGRGDTHTGGTAADRERAEWQQSVRTCLRLALVVWPSFFLADLYVVYVLHGAPHIAWFAIVRAGAMIPLLAGSVALRRPRSRRALLGLEILAPWVCNAGIGLMAISFGGLNSRYMQGTILVIFGYGACVHSQWKRGLLMSVLAALPYPAVLLAAAPLVPTLAAQWRTPRNLALFFHDGLFVMGAAVLAALTGHVVWATRRQLYEARKLGRYRLKARIGGGGMAAIWLARDEERRRDVALKILEASTAAHTGVLARFEREAQATMQLESPHTVRVHEFGASDDGVWFIALELLDGMDLRALVEAQGALPPARAVHFARQACASLAEAHAAGIIHRDVKPENLFAARSDPRPDHLKVLDFGIAKVTAGGEMDATATQAGWIGGTPAYMAPEVCAGHDATPPSDLYSLGATLFFLLTGAPPFSATAIGALLDAHAREAPLPPSRRLRGGAIPAALDRIVLRCLAKRPSDRFATAQDLDAALAALPGVPVWTDDDARVAWSGLARLPPPGDKAARVPAPRGAAGER